MKKILYYMDIELHAKIFRPFCKFDGTLDQTIMIPHNFRTNLGFKNIIHYKSKNEALNIVNRIKPDIFIQSRNKGHLHDCLEKMGTKKVMIGHGTFGSDREVISSQIRRAQHVYKRYDLICCAAQRDKDMLIREANLNKKSVVVTGLAQFDDLYNTINNKRFTQDNSKYERTILFVGANEAVVVSKNKYRARDEHYSCILKLVEICEKRGWNLLLKPRSNHLDEYLRKNKKTVTWAKKYINIYDGILKKDFVRMFDGNSNIYDLFNADIFVLDGGSTVEVEACLAGIPMVIVHEDADGDFRKTAEMGASKYVMDQSKIEREIDDSFERWEQIRLAQRLFIKKEGLSFDGKNCDRIINNIMKI